MTASQDSPVYCSVSLDRDPSRPRKQHGTLGVPYSHNLSGWASLYVPITVIENGPGPTVLALGGNHGDEYPGPVALMNLIRDLPPSELRGRLIIIPALNPPAVKAATRLSPLDGKNMNRSFPGSPGGTPTEVIAHYLTTVLFPQAEIVIDIHTGGRGVYFYPCAHMHLVDNLDQRRAMMAATEAWNTDFSFFYADIAGTGLLPVEAENQGKIVVTTEMGGGEPIPASLHRTTQQGLRNVLVQLGLLPGTVVTRADMGLPPTRWVQALDRSDYQFAPESGIFEALVDLGAEVNQGQPVARIHFPERPDRPAAVVEAGSSGIVICHRGPSLIGQGDCVAVIAHEVDPATLR